MKKIDLGLDEDSLSHAFRQELPIMLKDAVTDGHEQIVLVLAAETAVTMADDLEYAIAHKPTTGD